jgi:hypothetical protein
MCIEWFTPTEQKDSRKRKNAAFPEERLPNTKKSVVSFLAVHGGLSGTVFFSSGIYNLIMFCEDYRIPFPSLICIFCVSTYNLMLPSYCSVLLSCIQFNILQAHLVT